MTADDVLKGTLVVVLGGGQGERLYPLTRDRAKPAVPFGGIYRIIDFTLSNCLNSGLRRIYVLTQYRSFSLDRHLRLCWNCLNEELGEFVVPVPPQQRAGEQWYLGTADAIYQNIYTLDRERPDRVLILAGDHVYKMNYRTMIDFHRSVGAEITVGCVEVPLEEGRRFGVMQVDRNWRVIGFQEKPPCPAPLPDKADRCLASMGIYVFETRTLVQLVSEDAKRDTSHDFGKDILPRCYKDRAVYGFMLREPDGRQGGYWRDIGTIDAYWQSNMDLLRLDAEFKLDDDRWPIRTYQEQHPPARFFVCENEGTGVAVNSIVSQGCIIHGGRVVRSVLSPIVRVGPGSEVRESVLMNEVRVGQHCRLHRVIVDKRVVIPDGAQVGLDPELDRRRFTVTPSGIVVVPHGVPPDEEFWRPRR